jgi:uncharacterized protein YcbK (DUF882 family)
VRLCLGAFALLATVFSLGQAGAVPEGDRALRLHHINTGESATIVFKRNGVYDKAALQKLNYILRDWRLDRQTNMDPRLFDMLWEVYQNSGASGTIEIVCGYRSAETNALLRRRSRGVAQRSQHMLGKAIDFFIPGVPLAKVRELGLRLQVGGVGYYPGSAAAFVHMDTGGVRMWPRMSRDQLARVFPDGKTLYLPTDGRPLAGYADAAAAYKARKAGGAPVMLASGGDEGDSGDAGPAAASARVVSVALAAADVPLPRRAPVRPAAAPLQASAVVAMIDADQAGDNQEAAAGDAAPVQAALPRRGAAFFDRTFAPDMFEPVVQRKLAAARALAPRQVAPARQPQVARARQPTLREVDFDTAYEAKTPPVPQDLIAALAEREQSARAASAGASLPIAPTAVVATIDVTRPLRAEAMTTAVLRGNHAIDARPIPPVLAYAAPLPPGKPRGQRLAGGGVLVPHVNPQRGQPAATPVAAVAVEDLNDRLPTVELTLTALDTQGLRLWSAPPSTREKRYALLTMPDFSQVPSLLDKPEVTYAAGFGRTPYEGLRTDRFSGALVQPLAIVDLTKTPAVASR